MQISNGKPNEFVVRAGGSGVSFNISFDVPTERDLFCITDVFCYNDPIDTIITPGTFSHTNGNFNASAIEPYYLTEVQYSCGHAKRFNISTKLESIQSIHCLETGNWSDVLQPCECKQFVLHLVCVVSMP